METIPAEYLRAPFPYFGGKSAVADEVWRRFGSVSNYVEPFFGSGATLLRRPLPFNGGETVNDADGMVANFWRAVKSDPKAVAEWADWPVNENDLHARHYWLVTKKDSLQSKLEGDPEYCDTKIAGWWCWGMCCWIGSGFCSGNGPWRSIDGEMKKAGEGGGVQRQIPHIGSGRMGIDRPSVNVHDWMQFLSRRFRRVRVCCGDWSRVCGYSPTALHGLTAIFLDPPYSAEAGRDNNIYPVESKTVGHDCREWAIANGQDPLFRIALCGYEGEHEMPDGWHCFEWKARGGYENQGDAKGKDNRHRERIWFSPHCLNAAEPTLFS